MMYITGAIGPVALKNKESSTVHPCYFQPIYAIRQNLWNMASQIIGCFSYHLNDY